MASEAGEQLERIKKYSLGLQRLCRFFLVVMVVAACGTFVVLLSWSGTVEPNNEGTVQRFLDLNGLVFDFAGASTTVKMLSALYLAAIYAAIIKLVHHVAKLFGLYAIGQIFTAGNVREFRLIGIMMVLLSLTWLITLPIQFLLPEPAAAVAPGFAVDSAMAVHTENTSPFLLGIMVIIISWVMDAGRRLREEHDLVV